MEFKTHLIQDLGEILQCLPFVLSGAAITGAGDHDQDARCIRWESLELPAREHKGRVDRSPTRRLELGNLSAHYGLGRERRPHNRRLTAGIHPLVCR